MAKTVYLKHISVLSIFKLFGGMFAIIGFFMGLAAAIFGIQFAPSSIFFGFAPLAFLSTRLIGGLILGILYGFATGCVYAIGAFIYNIFASLLGGIKITLDD